jgi:hypothetical protein
MATTKNLVIDQGATFSANIQFLDNSKNPISLAGYSVRSKMRTSYDASNAAILTANVVNATTGNVNLFLTAANTSLLPHGRYVYDVEAYLGNTVVRVVEGSITVMPGVSGDSSGTILRQSISSLVNGASIVSLSANGNLTVPGPIRGLGNSKLDFTTFGVNTAYLTTTGDDSTALIMGTQVFELYANNYVQIRTNTAGVSNNWTFGADGTLTFPDNTSQSTAFISNNYISKATLKAIVANSPTYASFQANIAAL